MKLNQVFIGMEVVVENSTDAIIYTVEEIAQHGVLLTYTNKQGIKRNHGWLDVCYLEKPTEEQLNYEHN